jgi:hypothetical protein
MCPCCWPLPSPRWIRTPRRIRARKVDASIRVRRVASAEPGLRDKVIDTTVRARGGSRALVNAGCGSVVCFVSALPLTRQSPRRARVELGARAIRGSSAAGLTGLWRSHRGQDMPMNTICSCGYDCSDFIAQHTIPAGAQFGCPRCESTVHAAEETSDVPSTNLGESGAPSTSSIPAG